MSAGQLRNLVRIESATYPPTDNGDDSIPVWALFTEQWANIQYLAGKESSDDRDSTLGRANIKIRFRNDITNKMRVVYDSRIFEIQDNFDVNGKRQYLMMVTKVVDK